MGSPGDWESSAESYNGMWPRPKLGHVFGVPSGSPTSSLRDSREDQRAAQQQRGRFPPLTHPMASSIPQQTSTIGSHTRAFGSGRLPQSRPLHVPPPSLSPIRSAGQNERPAISGYVRWAQGAEGALVDCPDDRATWFRTLDVAAGEEQLGETRQAKKIKELIEIRAYHGENLRRHSLGTALGLRTRGGHVIHDCPAIIVFVSRKVHDQWLMESQKLPTHLTSPGGMWCDVDVVEFSYYTSSSAALLLPSHSELVEGLRGHFQRVGPGSQIASEEMYGTLGLIVRSLKEDRPLGFLTNHHVAVDFNQPRQLMYHPLPPSLGPGVYLGAVDRASSFASDYAWYGTFSSRRPETFVRADGAFIPFWDGFDLSQISTAIEGVGPIAPPYRIDIDDDIASIVTRRVAKVGGSSGLTHGTIMGYAVEYHDEKGNSFLTDFLIMGEDGRPFDMEGDSGSPILLLPDEPLKPAGYTHSTPGGGHAPVNHFRGLFGHAGHPAMASELPHCTHGLMDNTGPLRGEQGGGAGYIGGALQPDLPQSHLDLCADVGTLPGPSEHHHGALGLVEKPGALRGSQGGGPGHTAGTPGYQEPSGPQLSVPGLVEKSSALREDPGGRAGYAPGAQARDHSAPGGMNKSSALRGDLGDGSGYMDGTGSKAAAADVFLSLDARTGPGKTSAARVVQEKPGAAGRAVERRVENVEAAVDGPRRPLGLGGVVGATERGTVDEEAFRGGLGPITLPFLVAPDGRERRGHCERERLPQPVGLVWGGTANRGKLKLRYGNQPENWTSGVDLVRLLDLLELEAVTSPGRLLPIKYPTGHHGAGEGEGEGLRQRGRPQRTAELFTDRPGPSHRGDKDGDGDEDGDGRTEAEASRPRAVSRASLGVPETRGGLGEGGGGGWGRRQGVEGKRRGGQHVGGGCAGGGISSAHQRSQDYEACGSLGMLQGDAFLDLNVGTGSDGSPIGTPSEKRHKS